ncbi:MAG: hypothetical protein N2114_01870 [Candidatus Goldbacteria bacterium]|nr:hypothetical protein [Candidatus Goldiibacteriota bacterium]
MINKHNSPKIVFNRFDLINITIFIFLSLYVLLNSYFFNYGISPDSAYYLRAAQSILNGNWFYIDKLAGDDKSWFNLWPIGYPVLIAIVAFITKVDVYLASKILSIIIIFFILLIFKLRFNEYAWLFALSLINDSFLKIFFFTWSEQPFLLGLLWFGISVYDVLNEKSLNKLNYVNLLLSMIFLFLMRYIGFFSCCVLFIILLFIILFKIYDFNNKNKIFHLIIINFIFLIFFLLYLFNNKIHSKTFMGERYPAEHFTIIFNNLIITLKEQFYVITISFFGIFVIFITIDFIFSYFKNKKYIILSKNSLFFKMSFVFFVIAIFYFLFITYSRFRIRFDDFNFRFLYPFSYTINISLIIFFIENQVNLLFKINKKYNLIGIIIICMVISFYIINNINRETGYREIKKITLQKYSEISSGSAVLWMDKLAFFLRPDLINIYKRRLKNKNIFFDDIINSLDNKNIFIDIDELKSNIKIKRIAIHDNFFVNSKFLRDDFEKLQGIYKIK